MVRWIVAIAVLGMLLFVVLNIHLPGWITAHDHDIQTEQWKGPALRVALLADLHFSSEADLERLSQIQSQLEAYQPDVIVLAGDFAGAHQIIATHGQAGIVARMADAFTPIAPTVAVLGNHDNWDSPQQWRAAFEDSPIQLIEGRVAELMLQDERVCLRGLGDWFSGAWQPVAIPALCAGITLTVTHDPAGLIQQGELESISVAGHTHCGQISLPLYGPLKVPTSAPAEMHCGLYRRGHFGVTTGGLGTSILPLRFGPHTGARWERIAIRGAGGQ